MNWRPLDASSEAIARGPLNAIRLIGYARLLLSFALIAAGLTWLSLEILPGRLSVEIPAAQVRADQGCAYVFELPRPPGHPFVGLRSDAMNWAGSSLRIYEDGAAIGRPHSLHDHIRREGTGLYSHWGPSLYFSAGDCSDPRVNGRQYRLEAPVQPTMILRATAGLSVLALMFLAWTWLGHERKVRIRSFVFRLAAALCTLSQRPLSPGLFVSLSFVLVATACAYLLGAWSAGKTHSIALGSFYQISDAEMYWHCANFFGDHGIFGNEKSNTQQWCQRRSIYPAWLAGVVALGGGTIYGTLLVQAALVCIGLALLLRQSIPFVGWIGAAIIAAVFLPFLAENAWTVTMSESAGLAFGLAGFAMLLRLTQQQSVACIFLGCSLVSIALNARAGAFFVLPMLVIWAVIAARLSGNRTLSAGVAAAVGCSIGFLLQFLLVWSVGGDPSRSHGNFSYSLYGLSVGGLGWARVLIDHPELSSIPQGSHPPYIYGWAIENILATPWVFGMAIGKSLLIHLQAGSFGNDIPLRLSQVALFLWFVACVPLWLHRRRLPVLLVGLSSVGVLMSAPFIVSDGGPRIFSATLAVDALQMAIGAAWLLSLAVAALGVRQVRAVRPSPFGKAWPEGVFALFLVVCLLLPFAGRSAPTGFDSVAAGSCGPGEYRVITRIGHDSILLDLIGPSADPRRFAGEVRRNDLISGLPAGAWFSKGLDSLGAASILSAHQIDAADANAPGPYHLLSDVSLSPYLGKTVRICASSSTKGELFEAQFRRLESIAVLGGTP